jgi:hypothetical protein
MNSDLRVRALLVVLCISTAFASRPAFAEWQPGGTLAGIRFAQPDGVGDLITYFSNNLSIVKRNGADVVLWTTNGPGILPETAAPDRSGGVIYAAGTGDVFAFRVNSAGALPWGSFVTVCNATNTQNLAAAATDAAGNLYVIWKDQRNGTGNFQFFAQKLNSSGVAQWTANGVLVTSLGLTTVTPPATVVPDEAGGCIFAWPDARAGVVGSSDVYAQRIDTNGTAVWTANGVVVCNAAGTQNSMLGIPDGAGGAIELWMDQRSGDFDLFAQRIDPSGTSLWTANGVGIAIASGDQGEPALLPDGAGGAFVTWSDCRNCGTNGLDIYAQHLNSAGVAQWTANGVVVTDATGQQTTPNLISDGSGGIIVAWIAGSAWVQRLNGAGSAQWDAGGVDLRFSSTGKPMLATDGAAGSFVGGEDFASSGRIGRVFASGEPAWVPNYRATITSVADIRGDEGGWVSVSVARPLSDGSSSVSPNTTGYSLWRKRPGSVSTAPFRLIDQRGLLPWSATPASIVKYSDFPPGVWDVAGYAPAVQAATYSLLAPTHADSTASGFVDDSLIVVAHTGILNLFVVSAIAAGHSVDNLAPGAPQGVSGGLAGSTSVQLQWNPNAESDLWHYSVYRGTSPSFVPSAVNRIGQPTTASLEDDAYEPGVSHYKISAIDRHGNESGFTLLSPSQITSVPPGTIPARAYLARPEPNPFRVETGFEYGVAREGPVSLEIYDLRGRRIARLVDEVQSPGVRRAIWSGFDEAHHRSPAGVYLVRFVSGDVIERGKLIRTN